MLYLQLQYWVQGMKQITFREDEIRGKSIKARYGAINEQSTTEFTYTVKNLLPYTYMEAQICVINTYYVSAPSSVVAFVTSRGGKSVLHCIITYNMCNRHRLNKCR